MHNAGVFYDKYREHLGLYFNCLVKFAESLLYHFKRHFQGDFLFETLIK